MREKRDLVKSIQTKAQSYEDHGQYADALGQWEILKTIYAQYPGLDFEIERVRRRRDQQLLSDAKAKWVERIDWLLGAGNTRRQRAAEERRGRVPRGCRAHGARETRRPGRRPCGRSAESPRGRPGPLRAAPACGGHRGVLARPPPR